MKEKEKQDLAANYELILRKLRPNEENFHLLIQALLQFKLQVSKRPSASNK
jgi:hypothetical protein